MKQSVGESGAASRQSPWDRILTEPMAALLVFVLFALLPLMTSGYPIYILPQYMMFGVLAMSLGLIWGFAGILSFGQAAFFALGAYAMGLAMQQGLVINPAYAGLLAAMIVGGAVALFTGYFLFSAGVRATHFVLVTLALSIIVERLTVSQSQITGGWNGMFVNRMSLSFGPLGEVSLYGDAAFFYFTLAAVTATYFFLYWIGISRFGKVLVGIRENEDRIVSLGINPAIYKTGAFTLSGMIAGLAGGLYGTQANFVSPSIAGVLFSTQVVVWVAIGGRNSLLGALLGGIGVAYLANYLSAVTPDYWQLILGLIFMAVIVYFRGGVAGAVERLVNIARSRS